MSLIIAVKERKNLKSIKNLLKNATQEEKNKALVEACNCQKNLPTVKLLIQNNAEVSKINLDSVFQIGDLQVIKFLKIQGCEKTYPWMTKALETKNNEVVKYLIANENTYLQPLFFACETGNNSILKYIIKRKFDLNVKEGHALYLAIKGGNLETIKILLKNGVYCYPRKYHHIIMANKRNDILEYILEYYSGCLDNNLISFLESACFYGYLDYVKFFIEKKGVNIIDAFNGLRNACLSGNLDIIKYLISLNVDVCKNENEAILSLCSYQPGKPLILHSEPEYLYSPYSGSEENNIECIKYLIEMKADIRAKNDLAIPCSCIKNNIKILKFLIEKGLDVTTQNNRAVSMASSREIFEILIKNRADVSGKQGIDALLKACRNEDLNLVDFLIKNGAKINKQIINLSSFNPKFVTYFSRMKPDFSQMLPRVKNRYLSRKYYSRWRLIRWKNWFRKVVIPLYYSPRFSGYLKDIFTVSVSSPQNGCKVEEI